MIFDFVIESALSSLLYVASALLFVLYQVLSIVTFAIPIQISQTIAYLASYLGYVKGFIDITTLFIVVGIYVNFLIAFYTWKIIKWVYAHLPFIGKHEKMPHMDDNK